MDGINSLLPGGSGSVDPNHIIFIQGCWSGGLRAFLNWQWDGPAAAFAIRVDQCRLTEMHAYPGGARRNRIEQAGQRLDQSSIVECPLPDRRVQLGGQHRVGLASRDAAI